MFEAGFTYVLSKSLMNTRTIVSIHNTSEYSLFFFTFPLSLICYVSSRFDLLFFCYVDFLVALSQFEWYN